PSVPSARYQPYPPSDARKPNSDGGRVFQSGTAGGSTVCAVCLGIHEFVSKCRSKTLWNGSAARSSRDANGRLVNADGINICLDFQRASGCKGRPGAKHIHECS
ncbi:hypothetical protein GGX14DRAFT_321364, partial [Mycena pura]